MLQHQCSYKFYSACNEIGLTDIYDILMHRYADMSYLMAMPHDFGCELIIKAIEKHQEEMIYQKWLHDDARYEQSFNDYLSSSKPYRKSTQEEKDEILRKYGGL